MDTIKMLTLNEFLQNPRMSKPEILKNRHVKTTGFTMEDHINPPDNFNEVEEWCEYPYRVVWKSDQEMATLTYCEGDITVVQCPTRIIYDKELADTKTFYQEE